MQYFFVEFIDEIGKNTFIGGSSILGGAQEVAEKHAQRNRFGEIVSWTKKSPHKATLRGSSGKRYQIVCRDVNTPDVIKVP